jgi:hypothetical protein
MSIMKFTRALLAVAAMLFGAASAHSQAVPGQGTWQDTLQARDVGNTGTTNAFYDTALNITWLANANVTGTVDWNTAMSWTNNLTVGGVSGWRLPNMQVAVSGCFTVNNGTSCGWNVDASSSELAHLFYSALGNKASIDANGNAQAGYGLSNTGSFQNLQSDIYWTSNDYVNPSSAWNFNFSNGYQGPYGYKDAQRYAMAVHSGDVGAVVSAVPEPETYAMLLAGLGLIGVVARRRKAGSASRSAPCES